ncbi:MULTISPECIES: WhiB family transcriptional regulator [unclassified Pseudactinotalea]|uniref:WhiB family transcriptional regulator n=1 Tax=unclassified Pseudactinotalea TaxID=2649176 RepID=UPI00128D4FD8|nr:MULTISPECIES: WhiB family transcriptional regulator [unclassified Pseudactinotalea]MPV51236.1 WhiB family transcriptional regulator [Pseudactinotalea sp. HY160]QGH69681.1 WhiB family transcriptional regulator [Pseudactinotalea sp. HY158]
MNAETWAALPCRDHAEDLWFSQDPEVIERAKALCLECPLRAYCLIGAVERHEPWGVWGGQLFEDGRIVARKRPRGRPRKVDALT